jgi:hypothetical protein
MIFCAHSAFTERIFCLTEPHPILPPLLKTPFVSIDSSAMKQSSELALRLASAIDRRSFLRRAGGMAGALAALAPAGAAFFGQQKLFAAELPFAPGPQLDAAILNFALNLEYLEAEFYSLAAFGQSIEERGIVTSGRGRPGDLVVKNNPKVPFQDATLQQYAEEIANDEIAHVQYLRSAILDLGVEPVGRPTINLQDSFNTLAQRASISTVFDPFADQASFFVGGLTFSDVGVTAYVGAAPLLTDKGVLAGAAGVLATEAYHSSLVRKTAFELGQFSQALAQRVSDLRDSLDDNGRKIKDQGVTGANGASNIFPTNDNGLVFKRSPRQVLNIVYGAFGASGGLFFPNGLNGDIVN